MSHSVDVRIPHEYKKLILNVVDYLGSELPSVKTHQYGLLSALVFSPSLTSDVLYPYAMLDGFFLTRTFVQLDVINRLDFIFSPTSLFDFLSHFGCLNSVGRQLDYRSVFQWKLDYHSRSMTRVESKNRMFAYTNNGGLEVTRNLFQNYCKEVIEVNTAKIADSLDSLAIKRLGNCDW